MSSPHRILYVDDEPDIRSIVEASLGLDPDLLVLSCASAQEGLSAAAVWPPELILLDVTMPVMDGPAMFGRLHENPATASIPVVFLTAHAQAREIAQYRALGAAGVIVKPFDPMTLAARVHQYLPEAVRS